MDQVGVEPQRPQRADQAFHQKKVFVMNEQSLQFFLATAIADQLAKSAQQRTRSAQPAPATPKRDATLPLANRIANELVAQALKNGLPFKGSDASKQTLSGGNTAELVMLISLKIPFAFKFDQATPKLAAEAATMRAIKQDRRLPPLFRDAWATIYAIYDEGPYAYLMEFFLPEDGWRSLEDRLYHSPAEPVSNSGAVRLMHAVLDTMFMGYSASVNPRSRPNLLEDYCSRISQRLSETEEYTLEHLKSDQFASRQLRVNGVALKPWRDYVELLQRRADFIDRITPTFSTVTHGDPNPGNLMLRADTSSVELKLIDPKDWTTGDYLFDVTKITHFLEGTGPAEHAGDLLAQLHDEHGIGILSYALQRPGWTDVLVDACRDRTRAFAEQHGDLHWEARYELGMAANLLGLPLGRLKHRNGPRLNAALVLYGEGLLWLDKFCARLAPVRAARPAQLFAPAGQVEPDPISTVRAWVKTHVPGVVEGADARRGFQQLLWNAPTRLSAERQWELSFEHEARLQASDSADIDQLIASLMAAEGGQAAPTGAGLAGFAVRRYLRAPGPQSMDRYYDIVTGPDDARLIPRQITLRERLEDSAFMTWSSADERRAFNLELPFIALGDDGMTARVEFNWIDKWKETQTDCLAAPDDEARQRNPLAIAAAFHAIEIAALVPVLQHTTFRQKFGVLAADAEVFVINVDFVTSQDLASGRFGTYVDIDVSSVARIDQTEIQRLHDFVRALSRQFRLVPNHATKAQRSAQVTGQSAKW